MKKTKFIGIPIMMALANSYCFAEIYNDSQIDRIKSFCVQNVQTIVTNLMAINKTETLETPNTAERLFNGCRFQHDPNCITASAVRKVMLYIHPDRVSFLRNLPDDSVHKNIQAFYLNLRDLTRDENIIPSQQNIFAQKILGIKTAAEEAVRRSEQQRAAAEAARRAEQQRAAAEAARRAEQQRAAEEARAANARYPYTPEGIRASRESFLYYSTYRLYTDLSHMSNAELFQHYTSHGIAEGRLPSMPKNFNSAKYLSMYPDLYHAALGQREKDLKTYALSHYMNYGIREDRRCGFKECRDEPTVNQDLASYQIREARIQKLITQEDEMKRVSAKGVSENMPVFYSNEYKLHNDLKHMSPIELSNHYNNYGRTEGRLASLPNTFRWREYLRINEDLFPILMDSTKSDQEKEDFAKSHYMNYGFKEGRHCGLPVRFNARTYLLTHPDLRGAIGTRDEIGFAFRHYAQYGQYERRLWS